MDVASRPMLLSGLIDRLTGRRRGVEAKNAQFLRDLHLQMDATVPDGAVVFLGDSLTYGLMTAALVPHCVKFATGGQRSDELLEEMRSYTCLTRASQVVITSGTNDVLQGRTAGIEERYRAMVDLVPGPVLLCTIPPLQNPDLRLSTRYVVEAARAVCKDTPRCTLVDAYATLSVDGEPLPGILSDGVHLSNEGYAHWVRLLRHALSTNRRQPQHQ